MVSVFKEFQRRKFEKSEGELSSCSPQWQLRHQNRNSPRSLFGHEQTFEPRVENESANTGSHLFSLEVFAIGKISVTIM